MGDAEHYWEVTSTGAVTLVGLMFVVITFGADRAKSGAKRLLETYLTPTLVHLIVVFFIGLLGLSPEGDRLILPFGLIGVSGLVYTIRISVRAARNEGLFSDAWLFHGGIPVVCYVGVVTAAWLSLTSTGKAYSSLRAVSALLLLASMRNAWAIAIDIAGRNPKS
jgi:hypothetical protein